MLNEFGPSKLVALVINTAPDDRKAGAEFAERMPYTFVQLQADVEFNFKFAEGAGELPGNTALLDPNGRMIYEVYPGTRDSEQRTGRVIRFLEANGAANQPPTATPAQ